MSKRMLIHWRKILRSTLLTQTQTIDGSLDKEHMVYLWLDVSVVNKTSSSFMDSCSFWWTKLEDVFSLITCTCIGGGGGGGGGFQQIAVRSFTDLLSQICLAIKY